MGDWVPNARTGISSVCPHFLITDPLPRVKGERFRDFRFLVSRDPVEAFEPFHIFIYESNIENHRTSSIISKNKVAFD